MKATLKSMMVIGMMILGTATVSANSSSSTDKYHNNAPKKECQLRHIHDSHCGGAPVVDRTKIYPGMDKRLQKHIMKGDHKFNRNGVCKTCKLSYREISHIERGLHSRNHSGMGHRH